MMENNHVDPESLSVKALHENPKEFLRRLCNSILIGSDNIGETEALLDVIVKCDRIDVLRDYRDARGDSFLHTVAQFHQDAILLKKFLNLCPDLLFVPRKGEFEGQTVLHIAISKGNRKAVQAILEHKSIDAMGRRKELFQARAVGTRFLDTVMMGELPFTVAALTLNFKMIKLLLRHGAHMYSRNSHGDTVFHSLIKFASVCPDNVEGVMDIMMKLHQQLPVRPSETLRDIKDFEHTKRDPLAIWFLENNHKLTPIKLAASLGQVEIFCMILHLESVYCQLDEHDGIFDIHMYDITEIDTVTQTKWEKARGKEIQKHQVRRSQVVPTDAIQNKPSAIDVSKDENSSCCGNFPSRLRSTMFPKRCKAVLEIICNIDVRQAFRLINVDVVRDTIKQKWFSYRKFYYTWMVFHLLMMTLLTAYAIYKTEVINANIYRHDKANVSYHTLMNSTVPIPSKLQVTDSEHDFVQVSWYFAILYGILYIVMELIRSFYHRQGWYLHLIHHNGLYRATLLLFSFSLVVDSVWFKIEEKNNYFLVLALLLGWWFMTFFLRTHKKFSFFTVMFQKVLVGDMFRFSTIIVLELLSFSIAMHITFLNTGVEHEDFKHLGVTMLTMFKLMLGLGEIDILFEARDPWLAVTLFILFVLVTYVLLINSLIAMMSQTCSLVSEDRYTQWELQRLSVILMLESMIPSRWKYVPGQQKYILRYDFVQGQKIQETRFFNSIRSVQTKYSDGKAILKRKSFMRTQRFGDLSVMLASHFQMQQLPQRSDAGHPRGATTKYSNSYPREDDVDDSDDNENEDDDFDGGRLPFENPDLMKKTDFSALKPDKSRPKTNSTSSTPTSLPNGKIPRDSPDNTHHKSPTTARKRHKSEQKSRRTQTETNQRRLSKSFPDEALRVQLAQINQPGSQSDRDNRYVQVIAIPTSVASPFPGQQVLLTNQPNMYVTYGGMNNQATPPSQMATPFTVNQTQGPGRVTMAPTRASYPPTNSPSNASYDVGSNLNLLHQAGISVSNNNISQDGSARSEGGRPRVQFLDINNLNSEA